MVTSASAPENAAPARSKARPVAGIRRLLHQAAGRVVGLPDSEQHRRPQRLVEPEAA